MSDQKAFTGRTRKRQTRLAVRITDRLAQWGITVGGIGTIVTVSLVCVFLVYVVFPLFLPASLQGKNEVKPDWSKREPIHMALDEYQSMGWSLFRDGTLTVFALKDGQVIQKLKPFGDTPPTASAFSLTSEEGAFGFADGSLRLGTFSFHQDYLAEGDVPPRIAKLKNGELAVWNNGIVTRTVEGQIKLETLQVELKDPIQPSNPAPVSLIDLAEGNSGWMVSVFTRDGRARLFLLREQTNMLTGEVNYHLSESEIPYSAPPGKGNPDFMKLSSFGSNVYLAWRDGTLLRYNTREMNSARLVETIRLLKDGAAAVTQLRFLLGRSTLLVGQSDGLVTGWFRIKTEGASTRDGEKLVMAQQLRGPRSPVEAISSSTRSRMIAVGYGDGAVRVFNVTSGKVLLDTPEEESRPAVMVAIAPKDDGFVKLAPDWIEHWKFDPGYPEASLSAIFGKVWYEGYPAPAYVWQSSSATDSSEPKFSLTPLVFGTLKATFYSMLFGLPIALLAAVYTSEFLHPKAKARIKPAVEMMASLPSVVLGFLAALVFAPFVEKVVPAMLSAFIVVPLGFVLGGYLWQLLPYHWNMRLSRFRFPFIIAMMPLAIWASFEIGPWVERILFDGDIKSWLDGQIGQGVGGWVLLLLPVMGLLAAFITGLWISPWLRRLTRDWSRLRYALMDLVKFLAVALVAVGLAWLTALMLTAMGFDPRGSVLDTYVQRNALIVGIVMGFAIIPIIYTIAEDALSSVPEHLRSASLGAGATPWQTAWRIIIPTAMSGLFSAMMIGLGRAVGETMIVLMAAGNTPVMEMNIFNGFRTLSANIAVEMPEAVRDSTHYRILFLAALVLFLITFLVNTVAEIVRQRFRRRFYEL